MNLMNELGHSDDDPEVQEARAYALACSVDDESNPEDESMTLVEFAKSQGIDLLPWQLEAAEAYDRGERFILNVAKRGGRSTFERLCADYNASITKTGET